MQRQRVAAGPEGADDRGARCGVDRVEDPVDPHDDVGFGHVDDRLAALRARAGGDMPEEDPADREGSQDSAGGD